ncbi:liprin-beta-2 isoform X2 [Rhipicephalus sanguineus]|uniref:liprin-beta-2 isoform X2 n=1 Tax=Rhipicephalus sanguineus TaxID=34632 RepID=UPI001893AAF4|nr:liprin-beta-2 isoform X2 [Rhipicephalus sanguineus]
MYYGPRLQSSLSRRAWAAAEVGGVVDMTSEDPANSSPSTSGYSTPWSASLQRSQARRRLDHLDDRGGADDEDDDEDGGNSTPTPLHQPAAHQRPSDAAADSWSSGADWRSSRPPRRRRPARSSDHERGRSPSHARQPWIEERRSLDACDPHLLAVMAAAAQPWIAAAAATSSPPATPCCCSPPPQQVHCAHGCGSHSWASQQQQQRRRGCCCGGGVAGTNWTASLCGRCFSEPHPAPRGSPCQSWVGGGRCKTPVSGDYGDLQDKMSHLEAEKENLALQVSVLSDQLELQKDKIAELESSLLDKKLLLERTEQLLKQEMMLKKKIENDRLELLSDVPALKLKLVTAEREKSELESKVKKLETDVVLLRSHLAEREAELITRCGRVPASPHHGSVSSVADSFRATPTKLGADWKERSPALGDSDRQALPGEGCLQEKPPKCPSRSASATLPSSQSALRSSTPLQLSPRPSSDDGSHSLSNVRQYSNSLPRSHGQQVRRSEEAAAAAAAASAPAPAASSRDVFRSRKSSTGVSFAQPELVVARPGCQLYSPPSAASTLKHSKSRGLKKILGRLRRSNSHTMDVSDSFQRGGLRATAGPRLGWTPVTMQNNHCFTDKPVSEWGADMIAQWLERLGLAVYGDSSKPFLRDGSRLLKVTASELEKELGMRHPLHRKKLLLAVDCLRPEASELSRAAAALDAAWVLRWLDDVGLPQYKDAFAEALIDGAMLNALTVDDLLRLKVTNQFHHLSMKRGIQVLRLNRFNPSCLKRRSLPDECKQYSPLDVSLWTNHRVMEWLRTVDLSEYAPNLRGSGVHGALLIYEDGMTWEVFAAVLSIPGNKTLLRRHLSLQLKQLLGPHIVQRKRALQASPDHVPLSPAAKVKAAKKSPLRWRRAKGADGYLCPFEADTLAEDLSSCDSSVADSSFDDSFSSSCPREKDPKTAQEIEAVSNEISSFMKLQEVKNLDKLASTNI